MNIDNAGNQIRKDIDEMTASANKFIKIIVGSTAGLALLACFIGYSSVAGIVHVVELIQAVLLCSTALMGLSGLMIIEIKKANVTGLSSEDMFEKVKAINTITSLARAYVFLRWALLLSIFSIIFSCLLLIFNNPIFTIGSLAAFLDQIYLFLWGLMFSDFLPS